MNSTDPHCVTKSAANRWAATVVACLLAWSNNSSSTCALELRVDSSLGRREASTSITWYDARDIGVEGKAWGTTESYFDRLPARAQTLVRPPVWSLSHHTAGMCLRFATDATSIHVRWSLLSDTLALPHMPATGVSGVDLYVRQDGQWRWLATGRPAQQTNTSELVQGLPAGKREYLLYLPLYNGVTQLELGLSSEAVLWRLLPDPRRQQPLVFWGTSITQGGCASRPGMVHTAILGRRLDRPVINLGFSGNGQLEPEMARLIGEIDACVFVLDCLPNLTPEQVQLRTEPAVDILRQARPDTPILLVEDRSYADAFLMADRAQRNRDSRLALRAAYERLLARGVTELYYLSGAELLGSDGEDTVDGSHPTDLGFLRQAAAFEISLVAILEGTPPVK